MDNSQSSDVSDVSIMSLQQSSVVMDNNAYELLLKNTKELLGQSISDYKSDFFNHFNSLLDDCHTCIMQSLYDAVQVLSNSDILFDKLTKYLEDSIHLLQLLSNYIKNVIESVSMSCASMKNFPTTTGLIIMEVFTHCRNSESVYGPYLKNVERQLKDLFRTCHELQLTYLMVLERSFIFDLTDTDELDIFIEALDINLKIGEVVQALDVKTMAEQWKAYLILCEKNSRCLMDKTIYQKSTRLLCEMATDNLKTALEVNQDEKIVMRSTKVTSFMIRILIKMFNIFKHAANKDYTHVLEFLIYVYLHNPAYLETVGGKSTQNMNDISANVLKPADMLLRELIGDEQFVDVVITYDLDELQENDKMLGFIYLTVCILKTVSYENEQCHHLSKHKVLSCIFNFLPRSHLWFNMGLKFKISEGGTVGLFEWLVGAAAAGAGGLSPREGAALEATLCRALLGTDCLVAMFASHLWITLSRCHNNRQLLFNQLTFLCQTYQKLENHRLFKYSPQRVFISYTMEMLFDIMHLEDKVRLYKQYNPLQGTRNVSLWGVLLIKSLPREFQRGVEEEFIERFKIELRKMSQESGNEEALSDLIKIMNILATCSLRSDEVLEECIVMSWLKACPKNLQFLSEHMNANTLWYFEYVEALTRLTCALEEIIVEKSSNIVKILHVISGIIQLSNTELNLLLIDLLCKFAVNPLQNNIHTAEDLIVQSLKNLVQHSNCLVRNKLFKLVYMQDSRYLEQLISVVVNEEPNLQQMWENFAKTDRNYVKLKEQLKILNDFKYIHKCIETRSELGQNSETVDDLQRTCSTNFDFADIDSLFSSESDAEPACKKMKLESSEAEVILSRLENDTSLLCKIKENLFTTEHKTRIINVYEKLKTLVHE